MLGIICGSVGTSARGIPQTRVLLIRRYRAGERLTYDMKGTNGNWRYLIQARGVVKRNRNGTFVEEYAWSNLVSNGATIRFPQASAQFRQMLSLDARVPPAISNLGAVSPMLIGPITDLTTFYADLWLAMHLGPKLSHAGDHSYVKFGRPASWADGKRVILGEDSLDFAFMLQKIDPSTHTATLLVRHLPPTQPQVRLPATWMREPVADTPNNWVQVMKDGNNFVAAVGKETFEVRMTVSLTGGKIFAASLENFVSAQQRNCRRAALTECQAARRVDISRHVAISLEH